MIKVIMIIVPTLFFALFLFLYFPPYFDNLLMPQQTPIRKVLWTSASWSNGNERTLESDQRDPYDSQFIRGGQGDRIWIIDGNGNAIIEQGGGSRAYILTKNKDVQLTIFVIANT
jgi:hypothetical protein